MNSLNIKNDLKTFIKPYTSFICLSGFLITIESLTGLSIPKVLSHLIDSGIIFERNPMLWILLLTGLFMIWYFCAIGATYFLGSAASRFVRTIRDEMSKNLLRAKLTFHTEGAAGEHLSRLINDVAILHSIVADHLAQIISSSFIFVGGIIFIVIIDWRLALWLLVLIPIAAFLIKLIGRELRIAMRNVQNRLGNVSSIASEYLQNIHTIKAFGMEAFCQRRIQDYLDNVLEAALKRVKVQMIYQPSMGFISFFIFISLAWMSTWALHLDRISTGQLAAFLLYSGIIGAAVTRLSSLYGKMQEAMGAADRIFSILEAPSERHNGQMSITMVSPVSVEFSDIHFTYTPEISLFNGLSFKVDAGRTVALIGPNGCGKSTVFNLILGFYECASGRVIINDKPIFDMDIQLFRRQIGYMPQRISIFRGTIHSNLIFGISDAPQKEVEKAAKKANIHDFILSLPKQYETPVGEMGVTLSAGQQQRIALARVFLKDPMFMLLDEPTAYLDKKSEKHILDILFSTYKGRTIIIATHENSIAEKADIVIEL